MPQTSLIMRMAVFLVHLSKSHDINRIHEYLVSDALTPKAKDPSERRK